MNLRKSRRTIPKKKKVVAFLRYMKTVIWQAWRGGGINSKVRRFLERRPLDLKSTGNGSIGIDLTSKKDLMKKYLFFFENELIKVENSWLFSDFAQIPLVLVVNYNEKQWEKSTKWTKSPNIHEFSTLMSSFSKKNKYFSMKYFLEVRSIPILPFPLLFSSSGRLRKVWHPLKLIDPPHYLISITLFILIQVWQNSQIR